MTTVPEALTSRLTQIYTKTQMDSLQQVFEISKRLVTLRVNIIKSDRSEVEACLKENNISFTKINFPQHGYILDGKYSESDVWNLDIYKEGKIYLQTLSSQIPGNLFSPTQNKIKILDACAAPGGKTSQLSMLYPNAEITAFEPSKIRFEKMNHNLSKLGCTNVSTINDSVQNIGKHINPLCPLQKEKAIEREYFDIILVDAPCSSEGSLSIHNTKFLESWSMSHIKKNYTRQKQICDAVLPYLKNGGELIYSTCTLAPEENEAVIHYLLCNHPELSLDSIPLTSNLYIHTTKALKAFGKHSYKKEVSEKCLRILPSEYSEGFFIAKIRKGLQQ